MCEPERGSVISWLILDRRIRRENPSVKLANRREAGQRIFLGGQPTNPRRDKKSIRQGMDLMSQFLYIQYKIDPKGTLVRPSGTEMVAIELPAQHIEDWKLERPDHKLSEGEIAILITEPVAIATADRFVALTHQPLRKREVHSGTFFTERLAVMNERGCDYEDNGIRGWFIA
jgi:hypothetical protein